MVCRFRRDPAALDADDQGLSHLSQVSDAAVADDGAVHAALEGRAPDLAGRQVAHVPGGDGDVVDEGRPAMSKMTSVPAGAISRTVFTPLNRFFSGLAAFFIAPKSAVMGPSIMAMVMSGECPIGPRHPVSS